MYHTVTVINQDISTSIVSGINTSMSKHDYILEVLGELQIKSQKNKSYCLVCQTENSREFL